MANIYVRSTDGNNADDGSTWALAKATLAGAAAIAVAGDFVYVSQLHAETSASAQTITWAGTGANPVKIVCGNDAAQPPTALSSAATVTNTGAAQTLSGHSYWKGINFINSSGSILFFTSTDAEKMTFEDCTFQPSNSSAHITFGSSGSDHEELTWINCNIKVAAAGESLSIAGCKFHWNGGNFIAGSVALTNLFATPVANVETVVIVENVDLTGMGGACNLGISAGAGQIFTFRNCALPTGWSGAVGTPTGFARFALYNCAAGTQNYKMKVNEYAGSIRDEILIVRSGGASDGAQVISWKMVSNANSSTWGPKLSSDEFVRRFPGTLAEISAWTPGASKTVTVEIIRDSASALTDSDVWLEVNYLGVSGSPQVTKGYFVGDRTADFLTASANQSTSTATWGDQSPSMANPNKQKLECVITPSVKGYIHARVVLAKASTTIYVDPKMTIS